MPIPPPCCCPSCCYPGHHRYTSAIITLIAQDPAYLQLVDELLSGDHHHEQLQRGAQQPSSPPRPVSMSGNTHSEDIAPLDASSGFGSFASNDASSEVRLHAAGVYICALEKLEIALGEGAAAGPAATAVRTTVASVTEQQQSPGQPHAGEAVPKHAPKSRFIAFAEIAEAARERGWTALGLLKASSAGVGGGSSSSRQDAGAGSGGRLILAPPAGQLLHVQEGDMVAVLAHGEP